MDKARLYNRSNVLQRRDAAAVLEEYGHLLKRSRSKDTFEGFNSTSCSASSSSSSFSSDEEDEQSQVINPVVRVLDIGTGSGDVLVDFVTPLFAKENCHFVGADISEEMVRFGRENYASEMDNLEFERLDISGDIQSFLMTQRPFNHITSFYCFHWIPNQLNAMRNVYRLLEPNGNCLLAFIGNMAIFDIYEAMAKTRQWGKVMYDVDLYVSPYHHMKDAAQRAKDLMQMAGFENVIVESKNLTFHYNGIPALRKAVKAVSPFTKRMVEDEQEQYLDDYVAHTRKLGLMENPQDVESDIRVRVDYTLLVVYARK